MEKTRDGAENNTTERKGGEGKNDEKMRRKSRDGRRRLD